MGRKRKRAVNSMKSANSCFDLPVELLTEVLARLPAKTLLRLRCVCKEWRSLIDSSNFAYLQLKLCKNNVQNNRLFLIESVDHKRRCFMRCSDTFRRTRELILPKYYGRLWLIGYANGLVLGATFESATKFVVWNPSIRKFTVICPPTPQCWSGGLTGFTYVTEPEDDYKLVVITFDCSHWCQLAGLRLQKPPLPSTVPAQIYSLRTRSWRVFNMDLPWVKGLKYHEETTFLNGAIHWLGYHDSIPRNISHIVAFNMENGALNSIQLPDEWTSSGHHRHGDQVLAVLGESLAFLDMKPGCSFIWVMEQYGVGNSWVKRYMINLEYDMFILKRNGKLLVTIEQGIKEYDVKNQKIKRIAEFYQDSICCVDTFVENLILLT